MHAEDHEQGSDTEATEGDRPVFDEAALLIPLGGDRNLAKTIVQSAMADITGYIDGLARAIATGERKDARRFTHTMKGLTAQIGGLRLCGRVKEVEERLKGGGEIDRLALEGLRREFHTLTNVLQEWLLR